MAKTKSEPASARNPAKLPVKPGSRNPLRWLPHALPRRAHAAIAAALALITWLTLKTCLNNQFTGWDDPGYIADNPLVKSLSGASLAGIFTTQVMANYHPLTILSYAIEYSFVQLQPWLYHLDSLLLHIAVTVLVYWFTARLTGRWLVAMVTALLFGLHPMHVESVAWVSGRKDVVYGVFYMAACIAYLHYTSAAARKAAWYALLLLLYGCALLSKPVAVTLPLSLLAIDFFIKRPITRKTLLEKAPLFILSVAFGIISLRIQAAMGAMAMHKESYNPLERVALGCYALATYLWKAVAPLQLCCFYPYPLKVAGHLPPGYYAYPFAIALLVFAIWKYGRNNRVLLSGLLFFIVNIALLLQFLPVGDAIIADRYSYIPYLGLFLIAGWYVAGWVQKALQGQVIFAVATVAFAAYAGILAYAANERCTDWYSSDSLWRADIENERIPYPMAYNNLGFIYFRKWADAANPDDKRTYYDSAVYLLNKSIAIKEDFINPYISLGEMERSLGQYDEAKRNYYKALHLQSKDPNLYLGLAILYYVMHNYDSAGYFFKGAVTLNPSAESYGNYANFLRLQGKNDSALAEYDTAIAMNPGMLANYENRAAAYKDLGRWPDAMRDYDIAIKINPDKPDLYYNRSFCDTQQHNNARALQDVEKAISMGYTKVDAAYYDKLKNVAGSLSIPQKQGQ